MRWLPTRAEAAEAPWLTAWTVTVYAVGLSMDRAARDKAERKGAEGGLPPSKSYTIDELAALTGVPSRTIRFYQAKGALPPPSRKGRVAYYDESHAERLRLVAHMQDRGLSLRAIRDCLERTEGGDVSLSEWLGVGEQVRAPWSG